MELKQFVSQTLLQILEGVKSAQEQSGALGAEINPRLPDILVKDKSLDSRIISLGGTHQKTVFLIDFDVAITVTEGEDIKGGGAINVAAIKLGAEGASTATNTQQSRIKFLIPITLPSLRVPASQ
jgi:hypothetical protein